MFSCSTGWSFAVYPNPNRGAFLRVSWPHRGAFATILETTNKGPGGMGALGIDRAITEQLMFWLTKERYLSKLVNIIKLDIQGNY